MIEAKERKAAFLQEAVRVLALADVVVENAPISAYPQLAMTTTPCLAAG